MPGTTHLEHEGDVLEERLDGDAAVQEAAGWDTMPVFRPVITNLYPETGVLATAEVRIGNVCTIRNVKVKENDYGKEVVMPRTKMPHDAGYKDACFFESRGIREQFDQSVLQAYEQRMDPGSGVEPETEEDCMDMELEEGEGPEMEM